MAYHLSDKIIAFPQTRHADENGLLAIGGDLSSARLLEAYKKGIFPWYSEGEPILWWSPDPRLVLFPDEIRISRSLKKTIKKKTFRITADTAFKSVITKCAQTRLEENGGTWITSDMIEAYCGLHESGHAHSVEAWIEGNLVGGLYGVAMGRCFFGESMFTIISNASKVAFVRLVDFLKEASYDMIDCQVSTEHLINFGARHIPRSHFVQRLEKFMDAPVKTGKWFFN